MRSVTLSLLLLSLACESVSSPLPGAGDAGPPGDAGDGATVVWPAPVEWRRPIDDYIDAARAALGTSRFDKSVKELEPFDGRLYLGYGDWTANAGRAVGLQVRYFDDPEGAVVQEFPIEEESIDYYRIVDGRLFIPGVDATEDALVGNVFYKDPGRPWVKVRGLAKALHVLDVFGFDGVLFATGGAMDDMAAYERSEDQAILYRSRDHGRSWDIELEWPDEDPAGVARYEYFAQVEGNLYVFGGSINTSGRMRANRRRYDRGAWTEVDLLPRAWILRAAQLSPRVAAVRGVDIATRRYRAWRLEAGERATPLAALDAAEQLPVDFFQVADGELLILTRDDNVYPDERFRPFRWHIWRTHDLEALEELLAFDSEEAFLSLARWRGALYLGSKDGAIWRSRPEAAPAAAE